ncbi:MAG TPA: hypothetical protein EYG46_16985 [Myxococcales bacterium]|nr:hypothetical protein [Myxococcales bacterium]
MIAINAGVGTATDPSTLEAIWAMQGLAPVLECNTGGPRSRSRNLHLHSTILGSDSGPISCPRVRTVALNFGDEDPVARIWRLLEELGYPSPEVARVAYLESARACVCITPDRISRTTVETARPELVLEKALILGLSTPSLFDPARPVLWTRASLTRRLALYDIRGFYDD